MERTTRERVAAALRAEASTASELADRVATPRSVVYDHLRHVARSVEGNDAEQFLVAPPTCGQCGFADFDDPVAHPSRCPSCRSENVEEAAFKIEPVE